MRKNDSEMLLVYVDGTYANSYVKIGSSSVPLSSLRSGLIEKNYSCPRFPDPKSEKLNPTFIEVNIDKRKGRRKYVYVKI